MDNNTSQSKEEDPFKKIMWDFLQDIKKTFPEYANVFELWKYKHNTEDDDVIYAMLLKHCQQKFPPLFFDILYKNEDLFKNNANGYLLPDIDFTYMWTLNITEKTRETIWQYLQLILFNIIEKTTDKNCFGDQTSNLFSAISEDDIKTKIEEVIHSMEGLINGMSSESASPSSSANADADADATTDTDTNNEENSTNNSSMPNIENLHRHLNELLGGKIGQYAKELCEEFIEELDLNSEDLQNNDPKLIFDKFLKNPKKIYQMFEKITKKFEEKIRNGDLSKAEIIEEIKSFINKFKDVNIPGMEKIKQFLQSILSGSNGGKSKTSTPSADSIKLMQMKKQMEFELMRDKYKTTYETLHKRNGSHHHNKIPAQSAISPEEQAKKEAEIIRLFEKDTSSSSSKMNKQKGGKHGRKK